MPGNPTAAEVLAHLPLAAAFLANGIDDVDTAVGMLSRPAQLTPPADWRGWLCTLFPEYVTHPFAPHHETFWEWLWAIERGAYQAPFVGIWARGGAKSASVELGIAALAGRRRRAFGLYVSETQAQADNHVATIGRMFESREFGRAYPDIALPSVGKYGNQLGWRQNRLVTAGGFMIDAVGLDKAVRGLKYEEQRPDFIVLDDIDSETDSKLAAERKIETLTKKVLPAGSEDCIVLAMQNKVHPDSVFAQIADGRADFIADRQVSGPVPALEHAEYEQREGRWYVIRGEPTWAGQDLEACQREVTRIGISSFRSECQHEVDELRGGMFDHIDFRHCEHSEVPDLERVVVWVDPAVTDKDSSDSHGIQADGVAADGTLYRLFSWEDRTSPEDSLKRAARKAVELHAECVGVETDQGGDTWRSVYDKIWRDLVESDAPEDARITAATPKPLFRDEKAGAGYGPKPHRASQMLVDYERGIIVHVRGTHLVLERGLRRFPKVKPYDLVDAAFWAWRDLTKNRASAIWESDPEPTQGAAAGRRMWG